jgi:hypothetical protein
MGEVPERMVAFDMAATGVNSLVVHARLFFFTDALPNYGNTSKHSMPVLCRVIGDAASCHGLMIHGTLS